MATLTAGTFSFSPGFGLVMNGVDFDISDLQDIDIRTATSTRIVADLSLLGRPDIVYVFTGVGFTFGLDGVPNGGTLTGLSESVGGVLYFQASGFSVPVTTFVGWVNTGSNVAAQSAILAGADTLTGSALRDTLLAYGGNDLLDGRGGADILAGGAGNDTYVVDNAGDVVQEGPGAGSDTVRALVSYALGANVENLVMQGVANLSATGNALANRLTGNAGANLLDGRGGADILAGGAGNDTYVVDNVGDSVQEGAGAGIDLIRAGASHVLAANVENLVQTGTAAINATGNALANAITGNAAANLLNGGGGSDILNGGGGADVLMGGVGADRLTGGAGADAFLFNNRIGADTVTDFTSGADRLRLSQAGIRIGDGDTLVEGAVLRPGPGGFAPGAELVIVTGNIAGAITASSAAAAIGSASAAYAAGATRLFAVDNGASSALFLFTSAAVDAQVSAGELGLIATLSGTAATVLADYVFVA
jgi:Ca2+-binding RTX toxin-like protein